MVAEKTANNFRGLHFFGAPGIHIFLYLCMCVYVFVSICVYAYVVSPVDPLRLATFHMVPIYNGRIRSSLLDLESTIFFVRYLSSFPSILQFVPRILSPQLFLLYIHKFCYSVL